MPDLDDLEADDEAQTDFAEERAAFGTKSDHDKALVLDGYICAACMIGVALLLLWAIFH